MSVPVGPYCSDDLRDWWVPVAAEPNRMRAARVVRLCMDHDSVLRYVGRDDAARLDPDHENVCVDDDGLPLDHVHVGPAWHFEAAERGW